jgi:hypothetical protein
MAAIALLGAATWTTASGTKSVTATPAVGDLIFLVTAHSGNSSGAAPTDNQPGGTYTEIGTGALKALNADILRVWVRDALVSAASSTVFTHAPGGSTGGGLVALRVTGMDRVGAAAVRQFSPVANQNAGTPTPTFAQAPLTENAQFGVVFNGGNPATMTPRAGWTELLDLGYATPNSGIQVMRVDSGQTATAVAWGSSSATAYCAFVVELDTSVQPVFTGALTESTAAFDGAAATYASSASAFEDGIAFESVDGGVVVFSTADESVDPTDLIQSPASLVSVTAYGRPQSTLEAEGWLAAESATPHGAVNEAVPSDSQYAYTETSQAALRLGLEGLPAGLPQSGSTLVLSYRIRGTPTGMRVELWQGAAVLNGWSHLSGPADWTTYTRAITGKPLTNITDLSQLRLIVTAL